MRENFEVKILTDEERDFAELHHNEIYIFMKFHRLDYDIWYSEIVEGYLKAVRDYNRKEYARQYPFYRFANKAMKDCVLKAYRKENAQCRTADRLAISLDELRDTESDNGIKLEDIVADKRNFTVEFEEKELLQELLAGLTELQRDITRLLLQGYKVSEIARLKKITSAMVSRESEEIRHMIYVLAR